MTVKYSGEGIRDNTDETKVMSFDVSGVTTNTTRTLTMPDGDVKLPKTDGTSGQVLTSTGTGSVPTWQDTAGGGAGSVLQIVPFTSSTATNVTTSGTWTTITASAVDITSKQANSKFLYYFDMSVESDVSASSTYNFGQLARSGTRITASQQTLSVGHDTYESSPTTVFTYTDVPSAAAGTTITYAIMLNAQNSASFQINQQNLSGQEGGTSIHSNGYVMEIAV